MSARVEQVIVTELAVHGRGVEGDPVRTIKQFWDVEGRLLAEVDPLLGVSPTPERLATCACGQYPDAAAEAWRDLAEVAYGSRDAAWTSHRTLVKSALRIAAHNGARNALIEDWQRRHQGATS